MTILNKIAHFQNRRDEVPNQELARELAEAKNKKGIREIADNLWSEDKNVQSDCLKVLYEVGYLNMPKRSSWPSTPPTKGRSFKRWKRE